MENSFVTCIDQFFDENLLLFLEEKLSKVLTLKVWFTQIDFFLPRFSLKEVFVKQYVHKVIFSVNCQLIHYLSNFGSDCLNRILFIFNSIFKLLKCWFQYWFSNFQTFRCFFLTIVSFSHQIIAKYFINLPKVNL